MTLRAIPHTGPHPWFLSFLVTDGATTDEPGFVITGDFVFVGDLGRPDLLDEAAGGKDTRFVGAKQMFESLRNRFLALPDLFRSGPGTGRGAPAARPWAPSRARRSATRGSSPGGAATWRGMTRKDS